MGNIRRLQGRSEDSYGFNQRAASVLKQTVGERALWTAQANYRLACDEFDRKNYKEAQ